jgi:two-component system, LytTR family, sensor kinase
MKYVRIAVVHFILLSFISFISFWAIYIYQYMPEVHNLMIKLDNSLTLPSLVRSCFMSFGFFIIIIYSFYFFLFNLLFRRRPTRTNILYIVGIILAIISINLIVNHANINISQISGTLLGVAFFGGVGLGARAIIEYFKTKEKQKELESKNLKIELDMLRSRINPHFLFNTLNNIDALIRKDPERASELLIKLSQEMRYMLYDSGADKVSLTSEVDFIKDYISLQKLRVKNPNAIELQLQGNYDDIMVPPMLLIPFLENAFKYCNKLDIDKAIVFRLNVSNKELTFESSNYYEPKVRSNKIKTGGIGLNVVEKRLDLLFPNKHAFNIKDVGNQFFVSLKIQLDGN